MYEEHQRRRLPGPTWCLGWSGHRALRGIVLNRAVGGIDPWRWRLWPCRGVAGAVSCICRRWTGVPHQFGHARCSGLAQRRTAAEVLEVIKVMANKSRLVHRTPQSGGNSDADPRGKGGRRQQRYVQQPNHSGTGHVHGADEGGGAFGRADRDRVSADGLTGGGPKVVNAENPVIDYGRRRLRIFERSVRKTSC